MSYVKQCAGGMVLISEEIPSFNVLILPNGRKTKTIYFCLHASKKKPYVSLGGMVFKTIACQKGKKMVPHRSVYVPHMEEEIQVPNHHQSKVSFCQCQVALKQTTFKLQNH